MKTNCYKRPAKTKEDSNQETVFLVAVSVFIAIILIACTLG